MPKTREIFFFFFFLSEGKLMKLVLFFSSSSSFSYLSIFFDYLSSLADKIINKQTEMTKPKKGNNDDDDDNEDEKDKKTKLLSVTFLLVRYGNVSSYQ